MPTLSARLLEVPQLHLQINEVEYAAPTELVDRNGVHVSYRWEIQRNLDGHELDVPAVLKLEVSLGIAVTTAGKYHPRKIRNARIVSFGRRPFMTRSTSSTRPVDIISCVFGQMGLAFT